MSEPIATGKSEICDHVLDNLPEWIGLEDAKAKYGADVAAMPIVFKKYEIS